jgi:hypothetical protein
VVLFFEKDEFQICLNAYWNESLKSVSYIPQDYLNFFIAAYHNHELLKIVKKNQHKIKKPE